MRQLSIVTLFIITISNIWPAFTIAQDRLQDEVRNIEDNDSTAKVMTLAGNEEDKTSLFNGIIPPSPQSLSLARYAEYPVSHTTGIPDVSIPLYEIHVGGYTLPISLSYHSSGARVDDVPTCVGQGWTLNAGGAVIRTAMGAPDQPTGAGVNLKYMDVENVRKLIIDRKDEVPYGYRYILKWLLENNKNYDTESDRFSYNLGSMTGLFRRDIKTNEFVTLDHKPLRIFFNGSHPYTYFHLYDGAGNEFHLGTNEVSCFSDDGNGNEYTTAWYVDQIDTPYGNIGFRYKAGAMSFNVTRHSTSTEVGWYPYPDEDGWAPPEFKYEVHEQPGSATFIHAQTLVEEITWEGNKIVFSYSNTNPGFGPDRLDSMTVYGPDKSVRKTVRFHYTTWLASNSKLVGREMLTSVEDSEAGIYTFSYYDTASYRLPYWNSGSDTAGCSDLWGYYNGGNATTSFLPKSVADKINGQHGSNKVTYRDRDPHLTFTRIGVLSTVTWPTGGSVKYTYELNKILRDGKDYTTGGLRVSRVDVQDGEKNYSKKYTYSGYLTQDPPEQRMICDLTLVWSGVPGLDCISYQIPWQSVSSYPVGCTYAPSNPVVYSLVKETRSDGSRTEYSYDVGDLIDVVSQKGASHPSTWNPSLTDPGPRQPRLTKRSIFDTTGKETFRETLEYSLETRDDSITTGTRIYSNLTWTDFKKGDRFFSETNDEQGDYSSLWFGLPVPILEEYMFFHETTALRFPGVPTRKTEEDLLTGFKTVTDYSYDNDYRTLQPKSQTVANSDGIVYKTEYTYPFNHTDEVSMILNANGLNDLLVETRVYSGNTMLSKERIDYMQRGEYFYPMSVSSWSVPTGSSPHSMPVTLPVREQVVSYNAVGRPISIKVNDTDETTFLWNSEGILLESSTSPGGLVTKYTHKPLFGLASETRPNGYKTSYLYNSAGWLSSISDNGGVLEKYSYSIANHPTASMTGSGNSITTERSLHYAGSTTVKTRQYHDGLGRPTTTVRGGLNTRSTYLYSAISYDALGRECQTVMPSEGGTDMSSKTFAQVKTLSSTTYKDDQYAWSETTYDGLDRPVRVSTPGSAWHSAGKGKTTQYVSNAANSVRLYRAPVTAITLEEDGYYPAKTLQGVRTVDEDGNEMTVYTDRLGRKVLERRGPESKKGENDTYFVYNALGQLRYVLTPGYELSGFKEKFAYEYRYDEYGNVVKKFIPGAGYTQYWYDRAGRLSFMQDPNLREQKLHRFFVYDKAGRLALQGVSKSCNRNQAVNFANYTGGNGGFMSTGYTLTDASRLQQVTLENVNYYDAYTFASTLDKDLVKSGAVSAKGRQTGSVVYNSDGTKSISAIYYDLKGNVTECKERTSFGTLRSTVNTYTYSSQPLKSTVTEGSVTTITENTYDSATGLLTATDVTVNGVKQCVSAVTYDALGRIESVTRGAATKSGGTVKYKYNLHGQTTKIEGPGMTQNLYYADGPGKKLYNGSVSAMTWTMGTDTKIRGYKYSYNGYGWLTAAEYGENDDLWANQHRYTERFLNFMLNGGVRRLQRHGLKADGVYGKIDNLHITYDGNRITTVLEDADPVTQNGSMDYPGGKKEMEFSYNEWGALVRDQSRGITNISYDRFGNPIRITYSNGAYTENVYSASGEKLKTVHSTNVTRQSDPSSVFDDILNEFSLESTEAAASTGVTGTSTTEYRDNLIYRNGKLDMVLLPGGYATVSGSTVTFHYYTQDYLGNNRAVINGSTGAIEQTVAYYPYGGIIADLGNPTGGQPYKFGGKELITANGLNEYDFGARQYYSAVPGFTKPDPLCENTQWLSPYLYCGNNPVNAIDPDGRRTIVKDLGEERFQIIGGELDDDLSIYLNDKNGPIIGVTTSNTSFYNSDKGEWAISSVIDLNDRSGTEFLSKLENDSPNLVNYMWNARGNHKYDFKNTNGTDQKIDNIDQYRGMQITTDNGLPVITSARDIGNIGAGYMAGVNGVSWDKAVTAFDTYQTYSNLSPSLQKTVIDGAITFLTGDPGGLKKIIFPLIQNKVSEGISTRNAERYGWEKGNAVYRRSK